MDTKNIKQKLSKIGFYQQFPVMVPFIGEYYLSDKHKKLLLVGESYYLPKQEAVTGIGEGFCTAKKEHTGGHDRPLVRSDGLFHIRHALIVRVDGRMAPVKAVAFFLQIEAI